jgi:hypothetical protein
MSKNRRIKGKRHRTKMKRAAALGRKLAIAQQVNGGTVAQSNDKNTVKPVTGKVFAGINKGDVVRIKFRTIEELTSKVDRDDNSKLPMTQRHDIIDSYEIGDNIKALINGGDFVVADTYNANEEDKNEMPRLYIDNHYDGDGMWIYKSHIESIEVIDVANKFVSENHGIIMIQVDDKIYINGLLLENYDYRPKDEPGDLDKFLTFMEQFVVDSAMAKELGDDE